MGRCKVSMFVLICVSCLHYSYSTYIATFPKVLYPGIPLNVTIYIVDVTANTSFNAELLQSTDGITRVVSQANMIVQPDNPTDVAIVVPEDLDIQLMYMVRIFGIGGGVAFMNETEIHSAEKRLIVLIQTDKTRYSAGQEVKMRVILLLPNLLNYAGNVTVTILDGNANKIHVFGPQLVHNGVFSGKLALSDEPVFGTWRIHASANGIEEEKTFDVFAYVIPRFTVDIALPEVYRTDANIKINVTAKFTFNTDVLGTCILQIYNEYFKFVNYSKPISGNVEFVIPMTDLKTNLSTNSKINVRALVADNATFLTMVGERELKFAKLPEPMYIQHSNDIRVHSFFVPDMHYYTPIFIGRGKIPTGMTGLIDVEVSATTAVERNCSIGNPPYTWLDVQTIVVNVFTINFDQSGYASLIIPTNVGLAEKIKVKLSHGGVSNSFSIQILTRTPLMFMRIAAKKPSGHVGDVIILDTKASSPIDGAVLYETFSRGMRVNAQIVNVQDNINHAYALTLSEDMVPRARVIATYVTNTGIVISDHVIILTEGSPCRNKVNVEVSDSNLKPGENVTIKVFADPNSVVYMLAEDERNRALGTYNDIFPEEVTESITDVSDSVEGNMNLRKKRDANLFHGNTTYITARYRRSNKLVASTRHKRSWNPNSYKESGVILLTDAEVNAEFYSPQVLSNTNTLPRECRVIVPNAGAMPDFAWHGASVNAGAKPGLASTVNLDLNDIVRSRFPDTWIWDTYEIGDNGVKDVKMKVPDSTTTWVISTLATNPTTGFGIAETKPKIVVKKKLFLTLDLPTSIVKGEEVLIQVTVFNDYSVPQMVFLRILTSDAFSEVAAITVGTGQGKSTFVLYTPSVIGTITMTVQAATFFSQAPADVVMKKLDVIPGGVHKNENAQYLVDVGEGKPEFTEIIEFETPANTIDGTRTVKVTITGDVMVPSIDGLHNLIRLPYGCGEQTMLNFAPAVFITNYLKLVEKLTDEIRTKSQDALNKGYQREMNYRHTDGSFSAFGNRDPSGSTWLTAFVLKCFHQAQEYISIDQNVMSEGLAWLLSHQQADGSFEEPGRVIHTPMQSGTLSGVKLTAFILISILENRDVHIPRHNINSSINLGISYLESKVITVNDVYALSLLCYALTNAKSQYGTNCFTKLENVALRDGDKMYWKATTAVSKKKRSLQNRASSSDIEATSYSLLTYINLGKMTKAGLIVKWLVSQRNPTGGYQSTQDTVISLQALAEFSSKGPVCPPGYSITFHATADNFNHNYLATAATCDILYSFEVPNYVNRLTVNANGSGTAVIDVSMSYFVAGSSSDDLIEVDVPLIVDALNTITIQPHIRWNDNSPSGMIVMVVQMPTGFQSDNDHLKEQTDIKRYESNGRNLNLYFDGMVRKTAVIVSVKIDRRDPVVKSQPCYVTVYDYYSPTIQTTTKYEPGIIKRSTICDICPNCGICTSG